MARLPDAQALGERPSPQPSSAVAGFQTHRDSLDQSLAMAGQDLDRAQTIVEETNRRQDTIVAEAALNRLQEQRLTLEFDQKQGFRSIKEGGAVGQKFVDGNMARFTDTAAAIEGGLENDQQKALFKQRTPLVGLHYRQSLLQHQAHETDAFNGSTEVSALNLAVQAAALEPTNDIALHTNLLRVDSTVDRMGARKGLPAETVTELKGKYRDAIYAARVQSYLNGVPGVVDADPNAALARIAQDRDKMLPSTVLHLTKEATVAIRMLDNAQRIERDRVFKEAETATTEFRKFVLTGAKPDADYTMRLRSKTAGIEPFNSEVEALLPMAEVGAMHGSRSLPEQQEALRRTDATLALGSSPFADEMVRAARQITDHQAQEYKENPWAAGARYARLPSVPDAPLPNAEAVPQYVAQALPLLAGIETASGMPASPLQPRQAQKFAEQLQALPPGPRADALGATGEQLSAPRIAALADQLDKGNRPLALQLKIGAGRTTADRAVAELIGRGADALKDKTTTDDIEKQSTWKKELARLVDGTLGDAQMERDVKDMAFYVRATMAAGDAAPGFNLTASYENAVGLVIGKPMERAGVKTVLPRGMDKDQFTERMRQYTPQALAPLVPGGVVYSRGRPRTLEQISSALPAMGVRRDSQGRYLPVADGTFLSIDPEGVTPLRLEVR